MGQGAGQRAAAAPRAAGTALVLPRSSRRPPAAVGAAQKGPFLQRPQPTATTSPLAGHQQGQWSRSCPETTARDSAGGPDLSTPSPPSRRPWPRRPPALRAPRAIPVPHSLYRLPPRPGTASGSSPAARPLVPVPAAAALPAAQSSIAWVTRSRSAAGGTRARHPPPMAIGSSAASRAARPGPAAPAPVAPPPAPGGTGPPPARPPGGPRAPPGPRPAPRVPASRPAPCPGGGGTARAAALCPSPASRWLSAAANGGTNGVTGSVAVPPAWRCSQPGARGAGSGRQAAGAVRGSALQSALGRRRGTSPGLVAPSGLLQVEGSSRVWGYWGFAVTSQSCRRPKQRAATHRSAPLHTAPIRRAPCSPPGAPRAAPALGVSPACTQHGSSREGRGIRHGWEGGSGKDRCGAAWALRRRSTAAGGGGRGHGRRHHPRVRRAELHGSVGRQQSTANGSAEPGGALGGSEQLSALPHWDFSRGLQQSFCLCRGWRSRHRRAPSVPAAVCRAGAALEADSPASSTLCLGSCRCASPELSTHGQIRLCATLYELFEWGCDSGVDPSRGNAGLTAEEPEPPPCCFTLGENRECHNECRWPRAAAASLLSGRCGAAQGRSSPRS